MDPVTAGFNAVAAWLNYQTAIINRAPAESVGKYLESKIDRMDKFGAWIEARLDHLSEIGKKD